MIRIVSKHRASAEARQSLAAQLNKTEHEISLKGCDSGVLLRWHIHVAFSRKRPWIAPILLQCPNSQLLVFCTLTDDTVTGSVWNFSCSLQQRKGVKVKYTCHLKTEITQFKNNTRSSLYQCPKPQTTVARCTEVRSRSGRISRWNDNQNLLFRAPYTDGFGLEAQLWCNSSC